MTKTEHVEAVRSIRTGAIVLLNDENRANMLAKADMVSTTAKQDDNGLWVDANGEGGVSASVMSNDLARILSSLDSINTQREMLVAAALQLEGGQAMLKEIGIDAELPVADLPETTFEVEPEVPEMPEPRSKKRRGKRNATSQGI